MKKKIYWKDIRQSFGKTKGRFFSIFSLMMIGAMALIGLKVSAPNLEQTAQEFIDEQNMFNLAVMADYGLSDEDVDDINQEENAEVSYGYFTDVTVADSTDAVRVFSQSDNISQYRLTTGDMPQAADEIALASTLASDYQIGDTITFEQLGERSDQILKNDTFTITGFVDSAEIWDNESMGNSTAGYGELAAYGVTTTDAFDSDVYTIARLTYADMDGLQYSSDAYKEKEDSHKEALETRLADNGEVRLATLQSNIQSEIDKAQDQIKAGEEQLEKAKKQLDVAKSAGMATDEMKQTYAEKKKETDEKLGTAKEQVADAQEAKDQLTKPAYTVYTRESLPGSAGYTTYLNAVDSIEQVSNIFPVVLYVVAAMVTFTTMTRFVDEERTNAGLFKALGYTNRQIINKFVIYGLVASLAGTLLGAILGNYLLSPTIGNIITSTTIIGDAKLFFHPEYLLLAIGLALVSAVLPAYLVARRELTEKAAYLMQPKPPVAGSTILLEKITWIWERMSFTHKVTARNIFRYKQRMLMTIFGVAGAVALLFGGLGIRTSISGVSSSQFDEILQYDMIVSESEAISKEESQQVKAKIEAADIDQQLSVMTLQDTDTPAKADEAQDVTTFITDSDQLTNFIQLRERESGEAIQLADDGVVITEKLAQLYDAQIGDEIEINLNDKPVTVKVAVITEMYAGHFIYMTDKYYEQLTDDTFAPKSILVTLQNEKQSHVRQVASDFMALDGVASVTQNTGMVKLLDSLSQSLDLVMIILVVLSTLLGMVILYNLTTINVAERMRELSTIKVLGFHNKEVTMYIYRETIVLSFIGIIVGLIGGKLLHQLLLHVIGADNIMFNPTVPWEIYIIPIVVVVVIIAVLGWYVNHHLRKVDMLEALKSVE